MDRNNKTKLKQKQTAKNKQNQAKLQKVYYLEN
jgi:hypothetical protein